MLMGIDETMQTECVNTREDLGEHAPTRSRRNGACGGTHFEFVASQTLSEQVCVRDTERSSGGAADGRAVLPTTHARPRGCAAERRFVKASDWLLGDVQR